MQICRSCALALSAIMFAALPVSAQRIAGRIFDSTSGLPVSAALIQLLAEDSTVVETEFSDSTGAFSFSKPALPTFSLYAGRVGYKEKRMAVPAFESDESMRLELDPDPIGLPAVTASAESRDPWLEGVGFYNRMRLGIGQFITRQMLEDRFRTSTRVSEVLRQTLGVVLVNEWENIAIIYLRAPQVQISNKPCPAMVYVNGLEQGRQLWRMLPSDVDAIEVYRGPSQVPAQWGGADAECGVILIWLRTGR